MAPPQSNDAKFYNDIQQGKLLQQVETLANNVEKHAEAFKDIRDRVTALESIDPVVTHETLSELYERLTVLETNHRHANPVSQDSINKLDNRITILETKRITTSEIFTILISIAALIVSIFQIVFK